MAPFCIPCGKEMSCKKNGVVLHYGNGHCYVGDKFKCTECGHEIITGMGAPNYFPDIESKAVDVYPVIIEPQVVIPEDDRFKELGE